MEKILINRGWEYRNVRYSKKFKSKRNNYHLVYITYNKDSSYMVIANEEGTLFFRGYINNELDFDTILKFIGLK